MNLSELKSHIDITKKNIDIATKSKEKIETNIELHKKLLTQIDSAILVLTNVLFITQEEIISYIENVVTTALQYIYGENYSFKINYQMKRGQPETELTIVRGTLEIPPEMGGIGVLDIVSFALRCVCYTLIEPQPEPILIVDEPFRFISGIEQLERAEAMVKKLSDMLGIQIIIVSGKQALTEYADKIFAVEMINGESKVTNVN